jgi:trk system potassium uptake protein TrkH
MGGARLSKAESSPGQVLTGERFVARNRDAVVLLWIIYVVLNLVQIVLYILGGMSLFDSICHAFGTVSTAGYSPYNSSVGHFDSAYFDWVTTIFMFLGGVSFALFYFIYKRDWKTFLINTEFRWYCSISLFFSLAISFLILGHTEDYGLANSLRHGFFQTVSIMTTTGFTTVDYEMWPQAAQMFLVVVSFVGASAGSTTSGIKIMHYILIWKFMVAVIRKVFLQPLSVISIRVNQKKVDMMVVYISISYFIANIFLILFGSCVLVLTDNIDFPSAMSATVSALMNIGPGFGAVGPIHNFNFFSDIAKWFLSLNMLIGRLEMFSALALLYPTFWRR